MTEADDAANRLDEKAEKEHRRVVGRVLREGETFGREGAKLLSAARNALLANWNSENH